MYFSTQVVLANKTAFGVAALFYYKPKTFTFITFEGQSYKNWIKFIKINK